METFLTKKSVVVGVFAGLLCIGTGMRTACPRPMEGKSSSSSSKSHGEDMAKAAIAELEKLASTHPSTEEALKAVVKALYAINGKIDHTTPKRMRKHRTKGMSMMHKDDKKPWAKSAGK